MSSTSVRDTLRLHQADRATYEKLRSLGIPIPSAINIVSLWIWLQCIGINVIRYIEECQSGPTIKHIVAEAELILGFLRTSNASSPTPLPTHAIPRTAGLATEAAEEVTTDLHFFWAHKDVVNRGLAFISNGIGALVFDDSLNALYSKYKAATASVLPPELGRTFDPTPVPDSDDQKTFFVTIPYHVRTSSLTAGDIMGHMKQRWGNCVQRMDMKPPTSAAAVYGRGVFTSEEFVGIVFNGEEVVKLEIHGRVAWIRNYSLKNY